MTIELMTFEPPLYVGDASQIDIESSALFAKKSEIPAGFKKKLTPEGYRDEYFLRTRSIENNGREDTVGELEIIGHGKKISGYEGNRFTGEFELRETEDTRMKHTIDDRNPMVVIARPNALEGKEGIRVDHIVRYIPSKKSNEI